MCASYGALESTLVSTRSTVPETFASAAARTFFAVSPLRRLSVRPFAVWPPLDGSKPRGPPEPAGGGPRGAVAAFEDVDPEVAALASAAPPATAAPTAATVTILVR